MTLSLMVELGVWIRVVRADLGFEVVEWEGPGKGKARDSEATILRPYRVYHSSHS